MNLSVNDINGSLPYQPFEVTIESRIITGYTIFMKHYHQEIQKDCFENVDHGLEVDEFSFLYDSLSYIKYNDM